MFKGLFKRKSKSPAPEPAPDIRSQRPGQFPFAIFVRLTLRSISITERFDSKGLRCRTHSPRVCVLPGALDKLTVGGGVSWQSAFYGQSFSPVEGGTSLKQGSFTLVDLMTRYQYNEHLSFTANANNVFDKKYLTGLGNFGPTFYGEPRNLMLTTRWDF